MMQKSFQFLMLNKCFEIYILCFPWLACNNKNRVTGLDNVMRAGLICHSNVEYGKMVKKNTLKYSVKKLE